jgi:hypothetical protein
MCYVFLQDANLFVRNQIHLINTGCKFVAKYFFGVALFRLVETSLSFNFSQFHVKD